MKGLTGIKGLRRRRGVRGRGSLWGCERVCRSLRGAEVKGWGVKGRRTLRGVGDAGRMWSWWLCGGEGDRGKGKGWEGLGRRVGTSGRGNDREQEGVRGCAESEEVGDGAQGGWS